MLKRLAIGLLKGLIIGVGIGAGLQYGLRWSEADGLLGYLVAMGVGATTGALAGKPPWRTDATLEAVLRLVFGLGVGALLYWVGSAFANPTLPWPMPGATEVRPWMSYPVLYGPVIAALFAALIELDNSPSSSGGKARVRHRKGAKRSIASGEDDLDLHGPEV